jgi:TctA family transporter
MMEQNLSKALILFGTGNPLHFFTRPISGILLASALIVLFYPLMRLLWEKGLGRH